MYAVETHWIVLSGESSSRESVWSATLTIVVSRIDMTTPTITTPATIQTSRPRGSSLPGCVLATELMTGFRGYAAREGAFRRRPTPV
jgi:hypothetical protein